MARRKRSAVQAADPDAIPFWIGDLLNHGEGRWGGTATREMVKQVGYDPDTLGVYQWVAARVDISRRRKSLSFGHHQEVAGVSPDQQELILARAERDGWTREDVRHEVNRRSGS